MAFRHGIYTSEQPTPIVPPVHVDSALPVAFVTAPVHLARDPYAVTHVPTMCFVNSEAVGAFGFNMRPEIWDNYTACEVIFSQFSLYAISPIVIINVLDPDIHNEVIRGRELTLANGRGVLNVDGVLIDTVEVSGSDGKVYEAGIHYELAFNRDGLIVVNALDGISVSETLTLGFTKLAPEKVDIFDYIGGHDNLTGKNFGMELLNDIFTHFRSVPGSLLAPGASGDPVLAAVMETRASNIIGLFRCLALIDVPTMYEEAGELFRRKYTDVPAFKNQNNLVFPAQVNCYPKLRLGDLIFNFSTQLAGLLGWVDNDNSQVPYVSPSNKNLRMNGLCYEDGEEIVLNTEQANFLNGQGIMTATNFTLGWVAWGNRTGTFPGNTDPKDSFIPIRRMFIWIANTIVLTYWRFVDFPLNLRKVTTIKDSVNIWLNGLKARGFLLGGRIELFEDDNPLTDLMNGTIRFRVFIAPPPPMEEAEFILQYDPQYLQTLFA